MTPGEAKVIDVLGQVILHHEAIIEEQTEKIRELTSAATEAPGKPAKPTLGVVKDTGEREP